MLTVGDRLPAFSLKAVTKIDVKTPDEAFATIGNETYKGKWSVLFFWPKDFTFVCPTEIAAFGKLNGEFADRDAQLLGVSTDSEFVHLAWRKDHQPNLRIQMDGGVGLATAGAVVEAGCDVVVAASAIFGVPSAERSTVIQRLRKPSIGK